jgi:hypothetical protein
MEFVDRLLAQWETDCKINELDLKGESFRTPLLHAKYLRVLSEARDGHRKMLGQETTAVREIAAWLRGRRNTKEQLAKLGRSPQAEAITQTQLPDALAADPEVQAWRAKTAEWKDAGEFAKSILDELARRNYLISNAINLIKLETGK